MKTSRFFMLFLALWVCTSAEGDVDFVDTDSDEDTEVALKCDACRIVASKFVEAFADIQGNINPTVSPKDEEIIEAAEGTCDDTWEGYGVTFMDGMERLSGPGADVKSSGVVENDSIWSQEVEFVENICEDGFIFFLHPQGDGTFAACSTDNWGPWPGDDYEDYDDAAEFEDIHDEF
ncbi:marginal zone B- and B1-cell-specific protein-like [Homarus americanus]|uniref:marginal zone B- and B1-cell-specific protein-like n=1 Tax=Homarus americanus TaxID=6706 RepID=UPI001C44A600|nr:marginal zone B- and B1-cell-specific protein-like [Homarus americanus]